MLEDYAPILVYAVIGMSLAGVLIGLGYLVAPRPNAVKATPYESGIPVGDSRRITFNISFYLTAMLFLVFGVELVFLYPLAVVLRVHHALVLVEILVFIAILAVAWVHAWRRGALEWK
jgi:NADH-quinone oxidoreductase subunit A